MKISFFMPKLDIGGIERVFITYANELVKRGYKIDFVLCITGGILESLLDKDISIVNLGNIKLRKAIFPLRNYLKKEKPDFLYTGSNLQNMISVIAGYNLSTKIIISQHNYFNIDVQNQGKWSFFEQQLMRLIYPHAYSIIAVSKGIKEYLIKSIRIKEDKIFYLANPIDIEYTVSQAKENVIEKLPEKYIIYIGRLSPVKNLNFLLYAFEKADIDDTHLVVIGDGSEFKILKENASKLSKKDKILFLGSKNNPLPYLANALCMVLCSYSEALPTIILESMSLNVPIIATPTKGALELIPKHKGNYISKSFDDINEFKKLIELACKAEHTNMEEYILPFSKIQIVDKFESLIKKSNIH